MYIPSGCGDGGSIIGQRLQIIERACDRIGLRENFVREKFILREMKFYFEILNREGREGRKRMEGREGGRGGGREGGREGGEGREGRGGGEGGSENGGRSME